MIGAGANREAVYDTEAHERVVSLGDRALFPDPERDIALSPALQWLAIGYKDGGKVYSVLHNRQTAQTFRAGGCDL